MVYTIHYTRPEWNNGILPEYEYGELDVIEAFLIWCGKHAVKEDGDIAFKESDGKSLIMVVTPTGEKLFSFSQVYKYFEDNRLLHARQLLRHE